MSGGAFGDAPPARYHRYMLIVMKAGASRADVAAVEDKIRALGFTPNEIPGATRVAIGITGNEGPLDPQLFTRPSS